MFTSPRVPLILLVVFLGVSTVQAQSNTKTSPYQKQITAALDWLAGQQTTSGIVGGQGNYIIEGRVCGSSLAGLAWVMGGSTMDQGPHAKNVAKLVNFLNRLPEIDYRNQPRKFSQWNWAYGFQLMFLAQLYENETSDGKTKLAPLIKRLIAKSVASQEAAGGWTHGNPGPNPLGYTQFAAVSVVVLNGLGCAQQVGFEIPKETISKGIKYIGECSVWNKQSVSIGYSPNPGQRGYPGAGRSGAAYASFLRLGRSRLKIMPRLHNSMNHMVKIAGEGHADGMYHYLYVGMACQYMNKGIWSYYKKTYLTPVLKRQNKDGSFPMIPRTGREQRASTLKTTWDTSIIAILLQFDQNRDKMISNLRKTPKK